MKRILLYTAVGQENLWDECILASELRLLEQRFPDARYRVASYLPEQTVERMKYLGVQSEIETFSYFPNRFWSHPFQNVGAFFRNVWEILLADLIVIGGGGLFYDTEAGQSFVKQRREWSLRIGVAQLFAKKILYWAISVDLTHDHLVSIAWWFWGRNTIITVRDAYTKILFRTIGKTATELYDPVFLLPAPATLKKTKKSDKIKKRIGLALRSSYIPDEQNIVERMIRYLQARGFEVILLSHSLHPDSFENNDALSFDAVAKKTGVSITQSIEETLEVYPTLNLVVSMRLHAAILAVNHDVPFYAISYGTKTLSLLRDLNLSFIQQASEFDIERFKDESQLLIESEEDARLAIREKSDTIQQNAKLQLDTLFHGF